MNPAALAPYILKISRQKREGDPDLEGEGHFQEMVKRAESERGRWEESGGARA